MRKVGIGTAFAAPEVTKSSDLGPAARRSKGVNELQFKVKGQDYFLAFVEQEKRFYLFAPTAQGVHRIPVYVDAVNYEKPSLLGTETTMSS